MDERVLRAPGSSMNTGKLRVPRSWCIPLRRSSPKSSGRSSSRAPATTTTSSRLLKNGVWQWDRVLKTLILRSSWRKLGRWSRTLGLCCFLNPVLRGCRAWVAHCQVMPPWLLALPLPAPGVWPYGPDCRPWLPGTPPDRSGPAPDIASFGTRPLFSSTRRSPQPVSESAD